MLRIQKLSQCVAAIHVSHNLNIPLTDLKATMTGDTSKNLGKAIQALKPDACAETEAKKARKQPNRI